MATVEESYLDKLKDAIKTNQVTAKARAAGNWFRSVVNRTRGVFSDETPQKYFLDRRVLWQMHC